jgi:hypothetical protein
VSIEGELAGKRVVAETLVLSFEPAPSEVELAMTLTRYCVPSASPVFIVVLFPESLK